MSENVTHTAVVEDCFNLMYASDRICPAFKEVGREHTNFAQFGSVTRSGDKFTVQLLDNYRVDWETRKDAEKLGYKLAFVLGWLCHRAADRQMKVVFREAEPESTEFPTDCSLYHDAFIFRELYLGQTDTAFSYVAATFEKNMDSHPLAAHIDVHRLADLFRLIHQRLLIEMHTFIPDTDNIEGWFDKLHARHQEQIIHMDRYAAAVVTPDPAKVKRFVTDTNFYSDGDELIRLTKRLRRGETVSPEEIESAFAAEAQSHYAQAVKIGFSYLRSASDFFTGTIDRETLRDKLDIGRKGRDGLSV